ncbi:MAG: type II toxin-antitoxin system Phd/YefM family antitoxin [Bacillota bacterium]|jgi:antitoxin (DNA-binding transcriptional repressor) of toxin-antitoxin stability system
MLAVNTHEAKTRLSELLTKIELKKETVFICRNGHPIAKLIPLHKMVNPLQQDPELKRVIFHEDPSAPLDGTDWPTEMR